MDQQLKPLFTWTKLEKNRVTTTRTDPKAITVFQTLETLVSLSLTPTPSKSAVTTQAPLHAAKPTLENNPKRSFLDEELVKKLINQRSQLPLSSRILRPDSSS